MQYNLETSFSIINSFYRKTIPISFGIMALFSLYVYYVGTKEKHNENDSHISNILQLSYRDLEFSFNTLYEIENNFNKVVSTYHLIEPKNRRLFFQKFVRETLQDNPEVTSF